MSLHSIIEPAGTLVPGWKLVPRDATTSADIRNEGEASKPETDEGDRTPAAAHPAAERSTVTAPDRRSRWEMGEAG